MSRPAEWPEYNRGVKRIEAELKGDGLRIVIVASRFNEAISDALLGGALECLEEHGVSSEDVTVVRVPGAFEIPQTVARIANRGSCDAVVTIGTLIRGDTPHFDHISDQVTNGISRVAESAGVPVSFGVITCDTREQALARSGPSENKGWEAALAALELAGIWSRLEPVE